MPAPFGPTLAGFSLKTIDDIIGELEADEQANLGATVDVSAATVLGQLNAIYARQAALIWEAIEATHSALDPDQAGGPDLVALAAITGTIPDPSTKSTVVLTATGTNGTIIPIGRIFAVQDDGSRFISTATVTIAGGTALIPCESEEYGEIQAYAGTLNQIITPVGGLASVVNVLDAVAGRAGETDSSLRLRREDELRANGAATRESIRADVLNVPGVAAAHVFVNDTNATVDGVLPNSIEVMVQGGDDAEVRRAIYETKGAGINTVGALSGTVTDSEGQPVTIRFSRPVILPIYMRITIHVDPAIYPVNGDELVKAALAGFGDTLPVGRDLKRAQFFGPIFSVPGVVDVPFFGVGTSFAAAATQATHITIGSRSLADVDTGTITITRYNFGEDVGTVIP